MKGKLERVIPRLNLPLAAHPPITHRPSSNCNFMHDRTQQPSEEPRRTYPGQEEEANVSGVTDNDSLKQSSGVDGGGNDDSYIDGHERCEVEIIDLCSTDNDESAEDGQGGDDDGRASDVDEPWRPAR